jgi:hypothetical protein
VPIIKPEPYPEPDPYALAFEEVERRLDALAARNKPKARKT